jgi:hypothetical protein
MRHGPNVWLRGAVLPAAFLLLLAACSDDGPSTPRDGSPRRILAPLEGAVTDVPLVANVPTEIELTVYLPPDVGAVEAATIDVAATLEQVRLDGIPLMQLLARKLARTMGRADDVGATAFIRIGSDPGTVCEQGILYGPFEVAHTTELEVTPATAEADAATLQVINAGLMSLCVVITPNFDATFSLDGVAVDLTEASCTASANFAGTWSGSYQCGNSCGDPFGGPIELTVTQSGSQASYTDDLGVTFNGRVCGEVFRFERVGTDYIERGTLTLTGPNTAVKRSTWRNVDPPFCGGDCVDELTRAGTSDCPALVITNGPPPEGRVGQPYSFTATTSGGSGEVTRWVTFDEPIPGFEQDSASTLSGTPTAEAIGDWEIRVVAYDSCPSGTQTVSQTYTLTIRE